jgi:hypothetical protein
VLSNSAGGLHLNRGAGKLPVQPGASVRFYPRNKQIPKRPVTPWLVEVSMDSYPFSAFKSHSVGSNPGNRVSREIGR